jgi:hypothetical protein
LWWGPLSSPWKELAGEIVSQIKGVVLGPFSVLFTDERKTDQGIKTRRLLNIRYT